LKHPDIRRLFIAIPVPPCPAIEQFRRELDSLGRSVRPAPPGNLHLTLEFLGDVQIDSIPLVVEAMDQAGSTGAPATIEVRGVGTFPPKGSPRVVWLGVENSQPLGQTVDHLRQALDQRNFGGDRRPWSAHLTLARVRGRPPQGLATLLDPHRRTHWTDHPATAMHLLASTLTPAGPVYETLHTSGFMGNP